MSHFCTIVITPSCPIDGELEDILQPWHEFECTGCDDKYVQNIDETENTLKEFAESTTDVLESPTGTRIPRYDEQFYRDPTPIEQALLDKNQLLDVRMDDWNDGKGYRAKIHFIPDGWRAVTIPSRELMTGAQWAEEWFGAKAVLSEDQVDLKKAHKYGYVLTNENGDILKRIVRTNPAKYRYVTNHTNQTFAATYGDARLPCVQENPDCRGEFLLDEKGWLVLLLQGLYEAEQSHSSHNTTAPCVASEGEIWSFPGRILVDVEFAERVVSYLREHNGVENGRLFGGSLPPDWQCEGSPLHQLQHVARICQGQHIYLKACNSLSHSFRNVNVGGAKWDWWSIGGRYAGKLDGENMKRVGDLDWEKMQADAEERNRRAWDAALKRFEEWAAEKDIPPPLPFQAALERWYIAVPEARLRMKHNPEQKPLYKIIDDVIKEDAFGDTELWLENVRMANTCAEWEGVPDGAISKEEAVAMALPLTTFAFVKDGQWFERGNMGWWGIVTDEEDGKQWNAAFRKMLEELPRDAWLTVVDCHI